MLQALIGQHVRSLDWSTCEKPWLADMLEAFIGWHVRSLDLPTSEKPWLADMWEALIGWHVRGLDWPTCQKPWLADMWEALTSWQVRSSGSLSSHPWAGSSTVILRLRSLTEGCSRACTTISLHRRSYLERGVHGGTLASLVCVQSLRAPGYPALPPAPATWTPGQEAPPPGPGLGRLPLLQGQPLVHLLPTERKFLSLCLGQQTRLGEVAGHSCKHVDSIDYTRSWQTCPLTLYRSDLRNRP